jgi:hypothetical protein
MLFVLGLAFAIALALVMWSLVREQRLRPLGRRPARADVRRSPRRGIRRTSAAPGSRKDRKNNAGDLDKSLKKSRTKGLGRGRGHGHGTGRALAPDDDQEFLDELARRARRARRDDEPA